MQTISCSIMLIECLIVLGYSIFYPYKGMDGKNPRGPLIMIFPGVSISRYILPGYKFAWLTSLFRGGRLKICFRYHFFHLQWIKLSRTRFQGVHELDNHFVQGLFVFKNFAILIPVWIKNGIAHYVQQCNFVIS